MASNAVTPEPTSHTYISQRMRLHYLDWGNPSAPALLLLHGTRDHAHSWDWTARRLRERYHVVTPDLRGHGDSQWSLGSLYTPTEYVYDLAQLVEQQSLAPVRIVAHSLGGIIALRYAGSYPELVERLVIVDGTGDMAMRSSPRLEAPERQREWIQAQRALAARIPRRYATLDEALARMQQANPHLSPDQARHLTIHGANQNEDGSYSWKFDAYTDANIVGGAFHVDLPPHEVAQLWRSIACPVLFLTGEESWHVSSLDESTLVAGFQDARHLFVERAGHWLHHDQLDRFIELTASFLD
jgi:pimeloyl-ACP methyl ester carboxylesterase